MVKIGKDAIKRAKDFGDKPSIRRKYGEAKRFDKREPWEVRYRQKRGGKSSHRHEATIRIMVGNDYKFYPNLRQKIIRKKVRKALKGSRYVLVKVLQVRSLSPRGIYPKTLEAKIIVKRRERP